MRLFEAIKGTVTVGQAAEYYGMKIGRNNMICCLFHNDHHPSMKLNTAYYYCFGCGAYGRENSAYAPFFCPDNSGWKTLCKRDSWK